MGLPVKPATIFDFLNDISFNKVAWGDQPESDRRRFQPYMLSRWLSMHPAYLEIVADVQPVTSRLEPREFYVFFTDLLPKKKFFVKYVKSAGEREKSDNLIEFISTKLQVSKKDAVEMIEMATTDEMKDFLAAYGYTSKQMKTEFNL